MSTLAQHIRQLVRGMIHPGHVRGRVRSVDRDTLAHLRGVTPLGWPTPIGGMSVGYGGR